jgi:putative membrane protein
MNWFIRLLLSAVSVFLAAYILRGVHVDSFLTAILIALVIGILNVFIRPLLVILTIPITILTFGLFLLVVNALIVLLAEVLIGGFRVDGLGWAILFSLIVSFFSYLMGIRQIGQNEE